MTMGTVALKEIMSFFVPCIHVPESLVLSSHLLLASARSVRLVGLASAGHLS